MRLSENAFAVASYNILRYANESYKKLIYLVSLDRKAIAHSAG